MRDSNLRFVALHAPRPVLRKRFARGRLAAPLAFEPVRIDRRIDPLRRLAVWRQRKVVVHATLSFAASSRSSGGGPVTPARDAARSAAMRAWYCSTDSDGAGVSATAFHSS